MSANGYDIQKYFRCCDIAKNNGLTIEIVGQRFNILRKKQILGVVCNIESLFNFITGYDWGRTTCR